MGPASQRHCEYRGHPQETDGGCECFRSGRGQPVKGVSPSLGLGVRLTTSHLKKIVLLLNVTRRTWTVILTNKLNLKQKGCEICYLERKDSI